MNARTGSFVRWTSKLQRARRRPHTVRHFVVLLALAVAIPLVGLAFYFIHRVAEVERDATRAALLGSARSLASAVDQEIDKHIVIAATLSHSRALLDSDWPEFWRQAKASLAYLPESWLSVIDPSGQILLNTLVPAGTALPRRALSPAEREALATGRPQVSDLGMGAVTHRETAATIVPILRDGHPVYLLSIVLNPDRFEALLRAQHYSAGWLVGIIDKAGRFIARFPDEGTHAGDSASQEWRRAMEQQPDAIAEHRSLQGYPIVDAYVRSAHGWTIGVAIQRSTFEAPLRRMQWLLLAASVGFIGLGIVLAWLLAHRLHRSAVVLHDAAAAMAAEQPVADRPTGVREYDEAISAFASASRALRARSGERDAADQALRAREAELEAVINRTPFMLARCGRDLRYRFVSRGCAALLGRDPEEIVGRPIVEIIGEAAFETIRPAIERILEGERIETDAEVPYKNTGTRVIHVVSTPEHDEAGNVVGWVASILDITEQKRIEQQRQRAESALARSIEEQAALYEFTNKLYRAESLSVVYEAALDAILRSLHCSRAAVLRCDPHGTMRFVVSRNLSELYRGAVEGHSPWPADESNPRPVCIADIAKADLPDTLMSAIRQEGIQALSFIPLMASDGRLAGKFMAYYETPHTFAPDEINLALNLGRRLGFAFERMQAEQARQLAERELRTLKDKLEFEVEERTLERDRIWSVSEDLLGVSNFDGCFIGINPAWTRLLGWSEAEIRSLHVNDLQHPADAQASTAARAQLARGVTTVRLENRLRHKDGSWRWIQWTMTTENGLIYASGRHVTLEKEAAAALEQAQRRSAHSQKMEALGQLTGGVAHDFNNLLMIVSGHAQSLKRRLADPKDLRALEAVQIAATRGEGLTRQLLSFARSQPLNPTVIGLADTVEAIREVLSGSLHVNIELSSEVARSTWPVRVDKSELELALVNLTVNARDAMPGGGRLRISAANVCLDTDDTPDGLSGDFVALSVADDGSGISEDVLGRVFEPFFTTKGVDKGTGLGLSQVYGFARRSRGTAAIRSEPAHGTTVTIYLPRSHGQIESAHEEDVIQYVAPAGTTVLVIEDNHEVRAVTVSLLEQLGYRTVAVDNAAAALEAVASSQAISVVFSDVVLPGEIDGLLLARTLRARLPDIPIVLTTGYARVFDSEPEFPVLRKPYQISALGRIIRGALDAAKAAKSALAV